MQEALRVFDESIAGINQLRALYGFLKTRYNLNDSEISDLLRLQLVNLISAMDRYFHEVIRIGIVQAFVGKRPLTSKASNFQISFETGINILNCQTSLPPQNSPEYWINKEVCSKLRYLSYEQSKNVCDGLSLIWSETHKLQVLAGIMNCPGATDNARQDYLRQKLDLIVERRNQIVHEADYDVVLQARRQIAVTDVTDSVQFISSFVHAVHQFL